jgi:hypothetical protein
LGIGKPKTTIKALLSYVKVPSFKNETFNAIYLKRNIRVSWVLICFMPEASSMGLGPLGALG